MKAIFALFIVFGSIQALAWPTCSQREAQFMAQVTVVDRVFESEDKVSCNWKLSFKLFNHSAVCPLTLDEALQARIQKFDADCFVKSGSEVSGILVEQMGAYWIE